MKVEKMSCQEASVSEKKINTAEMGLSLVLWGRFLVHLNQRETARLSVMVPGPESRKKTL